MDAGRSTRVQDDRFAVTTGDGEYAAAARAAIGMTEPWVPAIRPRPRAPLRQRRTAPAAYRDRRVVIVGKRNSAFEIGAKVSSGRESAS
jgi:cation diffusion facilitator CzcD-associated flavoprotein CzcO